MRIPWKDRSRWDRSMVLVRIGLSLVVILLSSLQIFRIWDGAVDYAVPLLGVYFLAMSWQEWKRSRVSAVVGICMAVFLLAVSGVVWFGS